MRIDNLKRADISENTLEWLKRVYVAVDAKDAVQFGSFFSEKCELVFGNNPALGSRELIVEVIRDFFSGLKGLDHSFINILGSDDYFAAETVIDYTRLDDKVVTVPAVTIIERDDSGACTSLRIFIDLTPVYQ